MVMRARRAAGEAAKDLVGWGLHERARERWRAAVGRREVRKDIFFGGWDLMGGCGMGADGVGVGLR